MSVRLNIVSRVLVLVLAGSALGAVNNLLPWGGTPWVQDWSTYVQSKSEQAGVQVVDLNEAARLVEAGVHLIFDARPAADFESGHIPNAISMPEEDREIALEPFMGLLTPEQPILVYCTGLECEESLLLAQMFQSIGATNVVLFAGGYDAWQRGMGEGP